MSTAFVLIRAEPGCEREVYLSLLDIDSISETHVAYGEYDIIASVDAPSEEVALGVLIAIQSNDIASKVCVLTELDIDPIVGHANNARPAYAPPGTT